MKRASLCCANCKSQDLEVTISAIPSAVQLECSECGRITPLAVFADTVGIRSFLLAINDVAGSELYEESYCGKITPLMICEAQRKR